MTTASAFEDPQAYLPHRPPMVLLDQVLSADDSSAAAAVSLSSPRLQPFLQPDGTLPGWFGLEIMAQTVGIWAGMVRRHEGLPPPAVGFILSCRAFHCAGPDIPAGCTLQCEVRLLMQDGNFASFDCTLQQNGREFAQGRLSLFQAEQDKLDEIFS